MALTMRQNVLTDIQGPHFVVVLRYSPRDPDVRNHQQYQVVHEAHPVHVSKTRGVPVMKVREDQKRQRHDAADQRHRAQDVLHSVRARSLRNERKSLSHCGAIGGDETCIGTYPVLILETIGTHLNSRVPDADHVTVGF